MRIIYNAHGTESKEITNALRITDNLTVSSTIAQTCVLPIPYLMPQQKYWKGRRSRLNVLTFIQLID